jgi:hypothetical protein
MEPRPVVVLHDGRWLSGWLLAARRDAGEPWRGLVRYTVAPGMQYYHRRDESELRRNESSSNGPVPARSIPLHCDELRSVEAMPDAYLATVLWLKLHRLALPERWPLVPEQVPLRRSRRRS